MITEQSYTRSGMPWEYFRTTLADFDPKENPSAHALVSDYISDMKAALDVGSGLLFHGPKGVGKTMLSCIVGKSALEAGCSVRFMSLAWYHEQQLRRIELNAVIQHSDVTLFPEEMDEWRQVCNRCSQPTDRFDFLIVDDVGKEHSTQSRFIEDKFDYLVRERRRNGFITILTSNFPPSDWGFKYNDSMDSFVRQICIDVPMDGADGRYR